MLSPASAATVRARRLGARAEAIVLPVLAAAVVVLTLLSCTVSVMWVPPSLLVLPVLAGGLLIGRVRDIAVLSLAAFAGALVVVGVRGAAVTRPATFVLL